jgi:hypothetical protein
MAKNKKHKEAVSKSPFILELEGELTVLHLNTSMSKSSTTQSQIVVNCDDGKNYISEVVLLSKETTKKILELINYDHLQFRKRYVL